MLVYAKFKKTPSPNSFVSSIKELRNATGMHLKEAKDAVEAMIQNFALGETTPIETLFFPKDTENFAFFLHPQENSCTQKNESAKFDDEIKSLSDKVQLLLNKSRFDDAADLVNIIKQLSQMN